MWNEMKVNMIIIREISINETHIIKYVIAINCFKISNTLIRNNHF